MHRNKFGTEYDTLPGGNVELGETQEQALNREMHEETQVIVQKPRLVFLEHAGEPYGDQFIYLCEYVSGEPALLKGAEEDNINRLGQNLYQPMWVELTALAGRPFVSEQLKKALLNAVISQWPQTAMEIN